MLSMAAGTFQARWAGLPVFWRAQIAGWSLFAVVDLLTANWPTATLPSLSRSR
jgi:hypothetical protein